MLLKVLYSLGSSPLARGLPRTQFNTVRPEGIIPARAGFTQEESAMLTALLGSSPLARGLLTHVLQVILRVRIIPARAGFTLPPGPHHFHLRDHPRSRGVYSPPCQDALIMKGSSPLARGLLRVVTRDGEPWGSSPLARGLLLAGLSYGVEERIIPARAGFTLVSRSPRTSRRDHPRSRGVY